MRLSRRSFVALTGLGAVAALAAACGAPDPKQAPVPTAAAPAPASTPAAKPAAATSSGVSLTLYNAQHDYLTKALVDGFSKQTGIAVALRNGKDFELANQLVQEGANSPADVFITENSPAMQLVASRDLFAPLDKATLAQVPARFAPPNGDWIGVAARVTVLAYNPKLLAKADLPKSIMDLGTPAWQGKFGIAPSGADFQAIVSAVVTVNGLSAASDWLKGLKTNARVYQGNGAILKAVNAAEIPAGVIYHYYWYRDRAESGANSANTELHFFPNKDAGAFVSVSGLGVLKSSKRQKEAQLLVQYMTGKEGQKILAESEALEYPLGSGVPANSKLKPFTELNPPDVDLSTLNGPQVIQLMQQVGLL